MAVPCTGGRLKHKLWGTTGAIIFSALLLNSAYWFPQWCAWFVFIFLVPIFYLLAKKVSLSWRDGFLWGLIFFSGHWFGFFCMIVEHGNGMLKFGIIFFLILYGAASGAGWFWVASYKNHIIWWIGTTWLFFIFIAHGFLFFLGDWLGYTFGWPLVPLAEHPQWLFFLSFVPPHLLFLYMIVCAALIGRGIAGAHIKAVSIAFVVFLPWLYGWTIDQPSIVPGYVHRLGYIQPPPNDFDDHPLDRAQAINSAIAGIVERNPHINVIMMPESSFPYALNEHTYILPLLTDDTYGNDITVIVGAYRRAGDLLHNSLFWVSHKNTYWYYDKKTLVPCAEFVPPQCGSVLKGIFLKESEGFVCSQENQQDCILTAPSHPSWHPCICSDLFLGFPPGKGKPTSTLFVAVNDSWFSMFYIRHMMFLYGRYKAIEWGMPMIYVGHHNASYITSNGVVHNVTR
jgi:apolipoprotein N-acyltransferase